ncbi:TlpA family protein disulfide reductase [Hymenobacter nivis]|uniref:TlpA family protein disulfide reductase n=1 Tax=Hymenobacter nivis TaxID=1850093 RepID=A0A502GCT8_9BACT|nr:TlpA disulfide reductase family protein [Hymenobacter nivis]TPG59482.1 TlpA family protein disulfide reductase [Hymenobacter nivis]
MKHLLRCAGLLLAALAPACSPPRPAIPSAAAQLDALTRDFDTWYRYTAARVPLARDYRPRGVDGQPLPKKAFLQQLAAGQVLALRNGPDGPVPVYQLFPYAGNHAPAVRATSRQRADEALRNLAWEGHPLPAFRWRDLRGRVYTPASTRGRVVVVKCWYTSCVACVDEFAAVNALADRYPQVLFVSLARNEAHVLRTFLKERAVKFAVVPAGKAYLADTLGVFEYPTHFLLGPDGTIARVTNRASDLAVALAQHVPLASRSRRPGPAAGRALGRGEAPRKGPFAPFPVSSPFLNQRP